MAKKTVLIVDDNQVFGKVFADLLKKKGFDVRICDLQDYQCLRDHAPPHGRFEVLLDFSLELGWLEALEKDRKLASRLRIWIVTGVPDADIGTLRKRFPRLTIQRQWFDKVDPNLLDSLTVALRQTLVKRRIDSVPSGQSPPEWPLKPDPVWLQAFPEPIRVLDAAGKVVWANAKWSANPYTPPVDTEDLRTLLARQSGEWRDTMRWGPLPHVSSEQAERRVEDGYYRLRERGFKDKDAQLNILQWLSLITQPDPKKFHEEVERVLREITRTHFTRARFQMISELSGGEGIISLEQQVGGLAGDYRLPIPRPLKGRILDRLREYQHLGLDQMQELQYGHFKEAEQPHDDEWEIRNRIIGTEKMVDWIEIPILDRDGEKMRVLGLLSCDCRGLERPAAEWGKISDEAVPWLENYLVSAVTSLRGLLRDEAKRRRVAAHEAVMEAWRPLLHATGLENLEHALLQQAIEITDAEGGWLLTAVGGTEEGLEVHAAIGAQQQEVRPVIPSSTKGLATIDAWTTKGMIVEPWFRESTRFQDLRAGKVWEFLAREPADALDFQDWFERGIGSLVATPVKRGERVIGAVSLHHREEMHFDPERLVRLDDLLQVAAPLLEAETQRQGRTLWLGEVVHRIGARVNAVAGNLEILDQLAPDRRDQSLRQATEQAGLLRRLLTRIRDQEHQWQIGGNFNLDWSERFGRIRTALEERFLVPGDCPASISGYHDHVFGSTPKLKGDSDALDMVLEELLGNACRYTQGDGPIRISAEVGESYWFLWISNPGRILGGEEEEIFKLDRRGSNACGEGLGMGLTIARNTARLHSGNLVLEDSGSQTGHVRFRLEWPYAQQS
ncbi:MAG: hypothetical protein LGR52_00455 [Candidatus Thiosymbion ectosymbiont of Robbea hypermnestra]|nr:hypothetical protein [Candidatus Thiosymbion ectosymbiont of Robbea hypermnestra]